jgi:DNA helicase-2/ATP-dependent DNA helicase PcrA
VDADPLLDRLDAAQRRAVTSSAGLLAVIAGAGSGKTTVLSRRIAYRVAAGVADARHVLALTFTRQAAVELRNRLRRVGLRDDVNAGTFHAIALGVMRQRWADTNRPLPTVVNDRRRLVGEVLGETGGPPGGTGRARGDAAEITAEIDWARARLIAPDDYAVQARRNGRRARFGPDRVAEVYAAVEVLKQRRGIADLDDLLSAVLDAVRNDPSFGDALRWRFRHLFVDEAQDLNPLQAAVLQVLRGTRDDLTLVGDPNQSIYGFNGADPALLREVESRFPGIEVVRLDTNYRCTPQIVAAGASVLQSAATEDDGAGDAGRLASGRLDGEVVLARRYDDAAAEAAAVAEQVRRWGNRWDQIAVLARTNAQLAPLAQALEERGVPTSASRVDLRRALAEANGQRDAVRLAAWARDVLHPPLDDLGEPPARNDAFVAVALAVQEFLDDDRTGDGRAFGDWVRANRPFDAARGGAVELLSFHAAKGREWRRVIVAGVETGLVPHSAATAGERRAEEARLLYVALTRGADEVVITSAAARGGRSTKPSPFLAGLPAPLRAMPPPRQLHRPVPPPVDPVLERLDVWRAGVARAAGVSPHVVCTDTVLAAIAAARPATAEQLAGVPGMSVLMARRFGERILAAVAGP